MCMLIKKKHLELDVALFDVNKVSKLLFQNFDRNFKIKINL